MRKFDCENIKKVEDITSQCEYEDEYPGGDRDWDLVSCCQDKGYNELLNKLKKFKKLFPDISEEIILKTMCECCNKYNYRERTHHKYDTCVKEFIKRRIEEHDIEEIKREIEELKKAIKKLTN